jgi:hypothetical protein
MMTPEKIEKLPAEGEEAVLGGAAKFSGRGCKSLSSS